MLLTINRRSCTITEKAPTRAFTWLKAATTAFTFKTLLRHYAKWAKRALNLLVNTIISMFPGPLWPWWRDSAKRTRWRESDTKKTGFMTSANTDGSRLVIRRCHDDWTLVLVMLIQCDRSCVTLMADKDILQIVICKSWQLHIKGIKRDCAFMAMTSGKTLIAKDIINNSAARLCFIFL